ncbi:hypothetical protein BJ508DRAFT_331951 [Ascobolus immersus RN42]|uniref:Uncharacterized protein n=1 Tax=Ascobolus immersus RN42 TaxID=1160509 RepID=A0A3N4HRN2_ASCIM|nr:hypothetical protein BJ508DRAFT_331951 [Ascobolus immersus RN42]
MKLLFACLITLLSFLQLVAAAKSDEFTIWFPQQQNPDDSIAKFYKALEAREIPAVSIFNRTENGKTRYPYTVLEFVPPQEDVYGYYTGRKLAAMPGIKWEWPRRAGFVQGVRI